MTRRRALILGTTGLTVAMAGWLTIASREPDYAAMRPGTLAELERALGDLRVRAGIPGMSAAIAIGPTVVWARGFGWADLERRVPVHPESTSFHLASVTKPYAATEVLQLADAGLLDLEDPVSRFGIELPGGESARVWHLLFHSSGGTPGTAFRYDARRFGALTTVVERARRSGVCRRADQAHHPAARAAAHRSEPASFG